MKIELFDKFEETPLGTIDNVDTVLDDGTIFYTNYEYQDDDEVDKIDLEFIGWREVK